MLFLTAYYTRMPYYGSPKFSVWLSRRGYQINHKRVERLMNKMGLQAVCPKPRASRASAGDEGVKPARIQPKLKEGKT